MATTIRLSEIAEEVLNLIGGETIFDFLCPAGEENLQPLENRLQELLRTLPSHETIELAMYLRSSFSRSSNLATWQPLLFAAFEQGRMRGDQVDDIFFGFNVPRRDIMYKNTGNPYSS